ncbi:hypothetical protein JDV02_000449 [Purpureocillium takamizusanense]|uniref:Uncharacterized protein n=1 Tax=Purpureocillium takamizusanense TaxID=2060973 RepID=A0A9Q8Q4W3_9HYPO|nr:uncharacterized protein JDV02_000449 [Purpureocillium takamizusanense]UNI13733.1 hypothetical protein JDV02_000449 [Purpureocillium takamizusanense]
MRSLKNPAFDKSAAIEHYCQIDRIHPGRRSENKLALGSPAWTVHAYLVGVSCVGVGVLRHAPVLRYWTLHSRSRRLGWLTDQTLMQHIAGALLPSLAQPGRHALPR